MSARTFAVVRLANIVFTALGYWLISGGRAEADPVTLIAAASSAWTFLTTTFVGQVVSAVVLTGVSYLLNRAAMNNRAASQQATPSVQIQQRSGLLDVRLAYGEYVQGGGICHQKSVEDAGSTTKNIYVPMMALSEGECDSLTGLVINSAECVIDASGYPITAPWYDGATHYFKASFRAGTTTQAIDPIISARFPSEDSGFRQRGVCTLAAELNFGATNDQHTELWGNAAEPDVKVKMKGRKIYDPRDPAQDADDSSTWAWSDNATLVIADYLRSDLGFGLSSSDIDWASVIESANIDDEWVLTLDGKERRGRICGVVLGSEGNADVLQAMQTANRSIVQKTFGKVNIRADRAADPVATVHFAQIVGALSYQNEVDDRAALNTVHAQFYPAAKFNGSDSIDYVDSAALAADGETFDTTLNLRFTDSPSAAQRLAYAAIVDNRNSRSLTGVFDISVLVAPGEPDGQLLKPGHVVRFAINDADYAALDGIWQVAAIEINWDKTVTLSLTGYEKSAVTGWNTGLETAYAA